MEAYEIRISRLALGYTVPMLAQALGVESRTISEWERGREPIPELMAVAVKALVAGRDKSDDLLTASGTFASRRRTTEWSKLQDSAAVVPPDQPSSRRS